ncbi:MAG: hypothetical protein M1497_13590 [Nitrospirae bacterium]|nr:hypothetical protein [Nitrospirota bacterium]
MRPEDFITDREVLEELVGPRNRLIMVLGASDTGKTALVATLAAFLSELAPAAVVDLDMGQSHIGPPATIAWGRIDRGGAEWSAVAVEDFYFTGSTTPFGNLLPAVTGSKLMTDKALFSCRKVLVDTTGLVAEPAGRALKHFKIDLLGPDIILALEHSGELSHILDPFRPAKHPKVYRLLAPKGARAKTSAGRSLYRFEKMERYFADSEVRAVPIDDVGMRFTKGPAPPGALKHRIVSFRDEENRDIALGLVEGVKEEEGLLLIRTPLGEGRRFCTLVVGKTEMDRANSLLTDVR